jgi:hypothetical protein
VFIFLLLTDDINAQTTDSIRQQMDSIDICLLTCQPGSEVYSLYGHTAIRYHDKSRNIDLAINYGMFSFGKPYFILRFIFGLTDYEMGIEPFNDFCAQYAYENRGIVQQTINLTYQEKMAIANAIDDNYKPENRTYRYNYFYDNCTTRARDIILNHIEGKIKYTSNMSSDISYRDMTHQWNEKHLWARFGNDMLLGVKADFSTNKDQQQFLPDNLRKDFDHALIIANNGSKRKLVIESLTIVKPSVQIEQSEFPLRPISCAITLLVLTLIMTAIEYKKKCHLWGYDAVLMALDGLAGIILTAMIFSQHPTVSLNLQILLFNPLPLFFGISAIKALKKGRIHWYVKVAVSLIVLFYIGNFVQEYAEGLNIVALSLLIRCLSAIGIRKK